MWVSFSYYLYLFFYPLLCFLTQAIYRWRNPPHVGKAYECRSHGIILAVLMYFWILWVLFLQLLHYEIQKTPPKLFVEFFNCFIFFPILLWFYLIFIFIFALMFYLIFNGSVCLDLFALILSWRFIYWLTKLIEWSEYYFILFIIGKCYNVIWEIDKFR